MVGVNGGDLPSFMEPNYNSLNKYESGAFSCPIIQGIDGTEYLPVNEELKYEFLA